jgi:hypothetical protein
MGWIPYPAIAGAVFLTAGLACAGARGTPPGVSPARTTATTAASGIARIRFARGATSSVIEDSLPKGGTRTYVLWAERDQMMLAHALSWPGRKRRPTEERISIAVSRRSDRRAFTAPGRRQSLWSGRLPSTGEYLVRVTATGPSTVYTLAVLLPRRLPLDRKKPTVVLSGVAPSRAPVDYLFKGQRGQNLDADLQGSGPGTHLHIYGLNDGVQLARLDERIQRFTGTLPLAQDYVISVAPNAGGTPYSLRVAVQ